MRTESFDRYACATGTACRTRTSPSWRRGRRARRLGRSRRSPGRWMRPHELMARAERLAYAEGPPHEAESSTPSAASPDWFGPASSPTRAPRPLLASPGARLPTAPAEPVTEERVREIVREELRRLVAEAAP